MTLYVTTYAKQKLDDLGKAYGLSQAEVVTALASVDYRSTEDFMESLELDLFGSRHAGVRCELPPAVRQRLADIARSCEIVAPQMKGHEGLSLDAILTQTIVPRGRKATFESILAPSRIDPLSDLRNRLPSDKIKVFLYLSREAVSGVKKSIMGLDRRRGKRKLVWSLEFLAEAAMVGKLVKNDVPDKHRAPRPFILPAWVLLYFADMAFTLRLPGARRAGPMASAAIERLGLGYIQLTNYHAEA